MKQSTARRWDILFSHELETGREAGKVRGRRVQASPLHIGGSVVLVQAVRFGEDGEVQGHYKKRLRG